MMVKSNQSNSSLDTIHIANRFGDSISGIIEFASDVLIPKGQKNHYKIKFLQECSSWNNFRIVLFLEIFI